MERTEANWHNSTEETLGVEPDPEETVLAHMEREELLGELNKWLDSLSPRKAQVIRYRFGLDDGQPHTREETAEAFGVTRERIHQIEESTIGTYVRRRVHAALDAHRSLRYYSED